MDSNQQLQPAARVPRATYRFQFNEHFPLRAGLALVPYLKTLGISHVYASPLLRAHPHSTHGYDVSDFGELNPELGTEADLAQLVDALHDAGMGLVLDIVPNHMGVADRENRWWWDVLTSGAASPFAGHFDIDWQSAVPGLRDKVLLPILGDHYEKVLERHEIQLALEDHAIVLRYFNHVLPITPCSLPDDFIPTYGETPPIASVLTKINANASALDSIIRQQHYLLTFWQNADTELNYRRFFNVVTLAGIRVENERVFNDTHGLIGQWLQMGWVDGLRVDHPDGLRDPGQYLERLRALGPKAWIVVEKILQPDESSRTAWPVAGSTGYDFLNLVMGLLIDSEGERPLTEFYAEFTGEPVDFEKLANEKKHSALRELLATEVSRLTALLVRIAESSKPARLFKPDGLRAALEEVAASLSVYRTYIRPETDSISAADVKYLGEALAKARLTRNDLAPGTFDFLSDLLLLKQKGTLESDFVLRFQQLTGPAMAKGVEDTAFFCFNRFTALNEVGGNPGKFGQTVEAFHGICQTQLNGWPDTMLTTSTHDTKRSEDVRARLCALSEIPMKWSAAVRRWSELNAQHRRNGWRDANTEYYFYQTLLGAWPLPLERALAHMEKATREARQHTSWSNPNAEYEKGLRGFVTATLGDAEFLKDFEQFTFPLIEAGYINSLAQTLLKLTAPGVPDIYQGCELWDLSLSDPDNRRTVDFELRKSLLQETSSWLAADVWKRRAEGLPKLWLMQKTLNLRARFPTWFSGAGGYEGITATGVKSRNVAGFIRGDEAITLIQRLPLAVGGQWKDTQVALPPGNWRNEFDDERIFAGPVLMSDLLRDFPVALLTKRNF